MSILAPKSHGFINSCYGNIENKLKGQGEQFILINQADAIDRGIQEGEMIKMFNTALKIKGEAFRS